MNFSSKLVELMRKHKVTTVKLSNDINISEITINKLRTGHNINPTIATMQAIAKYFNVTIDYLINEDIKLETIFYYSGIDKLSVSEQYININEFINNVNFVVKTSNYMEYKQDAILLFKKPNVLNLKNNDIILINNKKKHGLCKLMADGREYIGKSLIIPNKFYEIDCLEDILGILIGVLYE